jgi:hypothetical protein
MELESLITQDACGGDWGIAWSEETSDRCPHFILTASARMAAKSMDW